MTQCWNCHRPSDGTDRVCAFCGAAVPPAKKGAPAPVPAPVEVVAPPPRERGTFTLDEPVKKQEAPRAPRPGLLRAVRGNLRAASILVILVCVVALVAVSAEGVLVQRAQEPTSSAEAADRGLFVSSPTASQKRVSWKGRTVTLEDAWIAAVEPPPRPYGAVEEKVRKRNARLRLYFRLASSGPEDFAVLHGPRETPVGRAELEHDGKPVVVYSIDLFGYAHPPELITLRSPDGAATLTLQ